MMIIGLTGGIATGKSTIASMFRDKGVPVHDADATVHKLLGVDGLAVPQIAALFGDAVLTPDNAIDRSALGSTIFKDVAKRKQLEQILHPLVADDRDSFLAAKQESGSAFVVLDVPLLFEVGSESLFDYTIVAFAPADLQYKRAIARPGMTIEKLEGILASQISIADKANLADLVLTTETSIEDTLKALSLWMDTDLKVMLEKHNDGDNADA